MRAVQSSCEGGAAAVLHAQQADTCRHCTGPVLKAVLAHVQLFSPKASCSLREFIASLTFVAEAFAAVLAHVKHLQLLSPKQLFTFVHALSLPKRVDTPLTFSCTLEFVASLKVSSIPWYFEGGLSRHYRQHFAFREGYTKLHALRHGNTSLT